MFYEDNQSKSPKNADITEIGVGLIGIGFIFYFLGVLWFLDRGFLAIGNVSPSPLTAFSSH